LAGSGSVNSTNPCLLVRQVDQFDRLTRRRQPTLRPLAGLSGKSQSFIGSLLLSIPNIHIHNRHRIIPENVDDLHGDLAPARRALVEHALQF
jgi:hypothetical protein